MKLWIYLLLVIAWTVATLVGSQTAALILVGSFFGAALVMLTNGRKP